MAGNLVMEVEINRYLVETIMKLEEQLKEANNIIVKADWDCDYTLQVKCGFSDYLKKYDVKGLK